MPKWFNHDPIWEAHFKASPLDTTIPVPYWFAECACDPCAYHDDTCWISPIWFQTYPREWDTHPFMWPLDYFRTQHLWWVCGDDDDVSLWHKGGEINGPVHWCERQRAVVGDD